MGALLKASLMALAAGCVLLFAGAFPLLGAPQIYHGGAMLLLGMALGVLSLRASLRLAKGQRVRLLCGLFCCFMAGAGLVVIGEYGGKAVEYAAQGGTMWFGAIAMLCTAAVGLIFLGVFGFFTSRLMHRRLWLAGLHLAIVFVLAGAYIDHVAEVSDMARLAANGKDELSLLSHGPLDEIKDLPFRLRADEFTIDYHDGVNNYALMEYERGSGTWKRVADVRREGDTLRCGDTRWSAADLKTAPGMPQPFLVAGPGQVILQELGAVKEYRAQCHITTWHKGRQEERDEILRVNEPLEIKGWQVTLMSHGVTADGTPELVLQLRCAPGRFWALTGMLGIIVCSAMWCWQVGKKEQEVAA